MRIDTLTTQFQNALADAQSIAVRRDHPYIEAAHVLSALLATPDSAARALLARSGVQIPTLQRALNEALARTSPGRGGAGNVKMGRKLGGLWNQAEKEPKKAGDRISPAKCF